MEFLGQVVSPLSTQLASAVDKVMGLSTSMGSAFRRVNFELTNAGLADVPRVRTFAGMLRAAPAARVMMATPAVAEHATDASSVVVSGPAIMELCDDLLTVTDVVATQDVSLVVTVGPMRSAIENLAVLNVNVLFIDGRAMEIIIDCGDNEFSTSYRCE
jgi:hypothetical protein